MCCTRCAGILVLFHDFRESYLELLNIDELSNYCNVETTEKVNRNISRSKTKSTKINVTDLLKHIPINWLVVGKMF